MQLHDSGDVGHWYRLKHLNNYHMDFHGILSHCKYYTKIEASGYPRVFLLHHHEVEIFVCILSEMSHQLFKEFTVNFSTHTQILSGMIVIILVTLCFF